MGLKRLTLLVVCCSVCEIFNNACSSYAPKMDDIAEFNVRNITDCGTKEVWNGNLESVKKILRTRKLNDNKQQGMDELLTSAFKLISNTFKPSSTRSLNSKGYKSSISEEEGLLAGRKSLNPHNNTFVNWLHSLVYVETDTLANFLRSYRVQLFYDLVFSIIKWSFYAYWAWFLP